MNYTRAVFLLTPLALLAIGCNSYQERTYQVGVRNDTAEPVTVWLCKDGPPYEDGWKSPDEIAIESPKAGSPVSGGIVPPHTVVQTNPRKGLFDSGTHAVLRVYAGQRKFNELLAIGRDSPERQDVKLQPGTSTFAVSEHAGKLVVDQVGDIPISGK